MAIFCLALVMQVIGCLAPNNSIVSTTLKIGKIERDRDDKKTKS